MPKYDYKVVPAPAQGVKAKGVKAPEDRFALALAQLMNALAEEGWEYQRAETLPCEESRGLLGTSTSTVFRSMLVFRRLRPEPETRAGEAHVSGSTPLAEAEPAAPAPARPNGPAAPAAVVPAGPAPAAPAALGPVLRAERAERAEAAAGRPVEAPTFRRTGGRTEPTLAQPPRPLDRSR